MAYYPQIETSYYATTGDKGGSYSYLDLNQLTRNFMVVYVGEGKLIKNANQVDVNFHARRALSELNYDVLRSKSTLSMTIGDKLQSMKLPNDFVNYVKLSWIDGNGLEHTILPNRRTRNPKQFDQSDEGTGEFIHDFEDVDNDDVIDVYDLNTSGTGNLSEQSENFSSSSLTVSTSTDWDDEDVSMIDFNTGRKYGLEPEFSNVNGSYYIDHKTGYIRFSSDLVGRLVTLQYISDGLGDATVEYSEDTKTNTWTHHPIVPKLAEEALYKHIAYAIVNSGLGYSEAVIARFKKEKFAETRKAKLRLSNLKFEEITQVLRGQSKWIKH